MESLRTPDELDSPFGTLRFFDGVPLAETVTTIYDALDLMRGIEVFLNCMPGASLVTQTRSLLQVPSTPHPALASNTGTLRANDDGSHDLHFGRHAPDGLESNWVETLPGRSWFAIVRLYGPLEPRFDGTWTLGEFQPLD